MFGPGLESETSGLTRKIIELKSGIFEATGMFPGQFDGLYICNNKHFNLLSAIYNAYRNNHFEPILKVNLVRG